ncbi:MAG: protein translocase subunit SecF [Parcubacteria group bacterium]|nr:protein translocase subunit SecF [Parcubacteria group bacterium]
MLAIIPNKKIYLTISAVLVLASVVAIAVWGLKLGIDFTGGSLWEVEFKNQRPSNQEILSVLAFHKLEDAVFQPTGEKGLIIKFRPVNENTHESMKRDLDDFSPIEEKRFESIGPVIGAELQKKSIKAIIYVLILIILYIAWAFRKVSKPVSSWKYGVTAIAALVHDVAIPTGIFAALGHFKGVEIDSYFVTAILTILGFSVHDTIVVFDRIRENLRKNPSEKFDLTVNNSVNETIARSINTSLTVFLVLLAAYFLGGESTNNLILALILGVFFGTYSSMFVASPILVIWSGHKRA